jgi:hypothetical protein
MPSQKFVTAKSKVLGNIKTTVAISAAAIIGFFAANKINQSNAGTDVYNFKYNEKTKKIEIIATPMYQVSHHNIYDLRKEFVDKELRKEAIKIGKKIALKLDEKAKRELMKIPFAVDMYGNNPETRNVFRFITNDDLNSGEFLYYIYTATDLYGRNPAIEGARYSCAGYGTDKPFGRFTHKTIDEKGRTWVNDTTNFHIVTAFALNGETEMHRSMHSVFAGKFFEIVRQGIDELVAVHREIQKSPQANELEKAYFESAAIFNNEASFKEKQKDIIKIAKRAAEHKK